MSICLCLDSAEMILDLMTLGRIKRGSRVEGRRLKECVTTKAEVDRAIALLPPMEEPLNLLVADDSLRSRRPGVNSHVWTKHLVDGSLIQICDGIYVVSPEFNALLGMGRKQWLHRPLVLMSACGMFAIDESSEDGFIRRAPTTDIKRLTDFAHSMPRGHRTRLLLDALELTAERARSPMEAKLVLPLIAPPERGGFGFEKPELNAVIQLNSEGQSIWGFEMIEGDILWRLARKLIEYNGRHRHEGRLGFDLTRASALEASEYDVRIVTYEQLKSARQMRLVGEWLAEGIGMPPGGLPKREALQPVLTEVLAYEHPKFSLPPASQIPDELRSWSSR